MIGISLKSSKAGFTIMEILIAMAIFAIGILGVAKMQNQSVISNTDARLYTERSFRMAGEIERLMNLDYNDPEIDDGDSGSISSDRYTINWTVTGNIIGPAIDTVKRIDVTVLSNSTGQTVFTATYHKAVTY